MSRAVEIANTGKELNIQVVQDALYSHHHPLPQISNVRPYDSTRLSHPLSRRGQTYARPLTYLHPRYGLPFLTELGDQLLTRIHSYIGPTMALNPAYHRQASHFFEPSGYSPDEHSSLQAISLDNYARMDNSALRIQLHQQNLNRRTQSIGLGILNVPELNRSSCVSNYTPDIASGLSLSILQDYSSPRRGLLCSVTNASDFKIAKSGNNNKNNNNMCDFSVALVSVGKLYSTSGPWDEALVLTLRSSTSVTSATLYTHGMAAFSVFLKVRSLRSDILRVGAQLWAYCMTVGWIHKVMVKGKAALALIGSTYI
ncbi:hypothetical protein CYLTODRAFT_415416 [Cylindrobasidium torrendii FP15055 ss-10]|uniref:Uncharacterized protein n=1 Tax=Cylindrobasidium torrendii FP15055 ss-10 TaxID=1314674 RepID=A0A0D7ASX9_9AGAR|nr:hypothetical protein CYLTODRAFT_415416 [Cylindrobasidium torrendii FP15055 ss-10]